MTFSNLRPLFSNILSWHPARIDTFIALISGMMQSGSVQHIKSIIGFDSSAQPLSLCQRVRRFLKEQTFDSPIIARLIMGLFNPDSQFIRLILDRTNWKRGTLDLNLLVLTMSIGGIRVLQLLTMAVRPIQDTAWIFWGFL